MLGKIFHISLVTMVAIIKERKKKMIEIMETFEKIGEEKESIFHGIDGRGMEMEDYLAAVKKKMDGVVVSEPNMRKLRELAVDAGFLYAFCGKGNDAGAVFREMASEKIQEMLAVAGMEEKPEEEKADFEKIGKQLDALRGIANRQVPNNPVLKRLIDGKAREYILGFLKRVWSDELNSFTAAYGRQKYDQFCLAEIRNSCALSPDEMDELFMLAGKGLGFFDASKPQYLHAAMASPYLDDEEALRLAAIVRKVKSASADSQDIDFMSGEDFIKELEQKQKCSTDVHPRKITSFKLPAVMDSDGITDAEASRFTVLLMKSGTKPKDGLFDVEEILEALEPDEKKEFTSILYASQENGTVIPGKRENMYPSEWTMEAPEVNYNGEGNTDPVGKEVPGYIDIHEVIATGKISEKELVRFLTLVVKAETRSQDALVALGSTKLTDEEKDELRSIIGNGLGIEPSKICPSPVPHSSVREGKLFAMVVTAEDELYPNPLSHYSEHPDEGILEDIVYGDNYDELTCNGEYEGLFYILYDLRTGRKVSAGVIDPDGLEEEIENAIG